MTPRSTVRLQLNPAFTLEQAARHVPYYSSLGISHLYLSPVSRSRKDSMHGYDVIDPNCVDPQLGGEQALETLVRTAHRHAMGLILDIVPNHMAAHPDNPWWHSVLKEGSASPYARWFDIQWDRPGMDDRILLPVLGHVYGVALERGDIRLMHDGFTFLLDVQGLRLPLAEGSLPDGDTEEGIEARLQDHDAATHHGRSALHALLQQQHYRLAWWQCAADQINWRRFFEISDLAGLRVERDDVFDAVHELPLRLFEQGWIDGLRVDHVDGLACPLSYCERLNQALQDRLEHRPERRRGGHPWLIVEKILASGEVLDTRWKVDGSTGYDFMEAVSTVMHDPAAEESIDRYWGRLVRDERPVDEWRRDARALMVDRHFAAERDVLLDKLLALTQMNLASRDVSRHSLGRALDRILIEFDVYRTYVTLGHRSDEDMRHLDRAHARARQYLLEARDLAALGAVDFILDVLKGRSKINFPCENPSPSLQLDRKALLADVVQRFQQLTPPLAAKALEDTVFYRYGRLLSRNEVGSDPGLFSMPVSRFHQWNQRRARQQSSSMNATATHDHKRGEDVRARLAVISELPDAWQELSIRCLEALGQQITIDCGAPAGHCYMLLQTVVGAWPPGLRLQDEAGMNAFVERLQAWQLKALREAKQRTSWLYPDEAFEQQQAERLEFLLCDSQSVTSRSIVHFVDQIAVPGIVNSLGAVVLRCTAPGVPDLYQGTDLWDFSLVDPDNRRQPDVESRAAMLKRLSGDGTSLTELLQDWQSGAIKQAVLSRCLHLRQQHPALFRDGDYLPLAIDGPLSEHLIAFQRHAAGVSVIVVVSRLAWRAVRGAGQTLALPVIPSALWQDTRIILPEGDGQTDWHDVLTAESYRVISGRIQAETVLARLPVAVLLAR